MIDGVTIVNEYEVTTKTLGEFNSTACLITFILTIFICAIVGLLQTRTNKKINGLGLGALVGMLIGVVSGLLFGGILAGPPTLETTVRYEVLVDNSISVNEFYETYNVIEVRGQIFVVEKKDCPED